MNSRPGKEAYMLIQDFGQADGKSALGPFLSMDELADYAITHVEPETNAKQLIAVKVVIVRRKDIYGNWYDC